MGLRKRGPYWYEHWYEGKRERRKSTKTGDRALAEVIVGKWRENRLLLKGGFLDPMDLVRLSSSDVSFRSAADKFLAAKRRQVQDLAYGALELHLRRFETMCDVRYLRGFTRDAVEAFVSRICDLPSDRACSRGLGLSARTVNAHLTSLHTFGAWLMDRGIINRNPVSRKLHSLSERKDRRRQRRAITDEEFLSLLEAAGPEHEWRLFYLIARTMGLRRGDLLDLSWRQVDLGNRTILIDQGKADRDDQLPMPLEVHALLVDLKARWGQVMPSARLFPVQACLSAEAFDNKRRAHFQDSGIVQVDERGLYADFHSLRVSLGTELARTQSPATTKRLMRHASIATTERSYNDLQVDFLISTRETLDAERPEEFVRRLHALLPLSKKHRLAT